VDAVDGLVGEEGTGRVAPPGSQRTGGGDEGPEIAVAGQGDEERRPPVEVVDAVPGLAVVLDEAAGHGGRVQDDLQARRSVPQRRDRARRQLDTPVLVGRREHEGQRGLAAVEHDHGQRGEPEDVGGHDERRVLDAGGLEKVF